MAPASFDWKSESHKCRPHWGPVWGNYFSSFQLPFQEFARSASFPTNYPTRQFVETERLRYRRQNLGQRNFTSGPRRAPLGLLVPIFSVISSSHCDKLPLGRKGWVAHGEGYGNNGNHDGVRRRWPPTSAWSLLKYARLAPHIFSPHPNINTSK